MNSSGILVPIRVEKKPHVETLAINMSPVLCIEGGGPNGL
jgi:hypothetical protein